MSVAEQFHRVPDFALMGALLAAPVICLLYAGDGVDSEAVMMVLSHDQSDQTVRMLAPLLPVGAALRIGNSTSAAILSAFFVGVSFRTKYYGLFMNAFKTFLYVSTCFWRLARQANGDRLSTG